MREVEAEGENAHADANALAAGDASCWTAGLWVVEGVRCDVRCGVWCGGDCIWCGRNALCLPTTYMNWTGPDVIGRVLDGEIRTACEPTHGIDVRCSDSRPAIVGSVRVNEANKSDGPWDG